MTTEPTAGAEASFSIESIKEIMDAFDPASLLPDLGNVFGWIELICRIVVLIGPALLLILGLTYLFLSPREANHYLGYRCYFGMGSVQAWRFTQRIAGVVLGVLGLGMGAVMFFISNGFQGMAVDSLVWHAARCLLWEAGLALAANAAIHLTAALLFDRKGEPRRKRRA